MTPASTQACAGPFFLAAPGGQRFCYFSAPPPLVPVRAAVLYVHPFAEEMNRSRRMAALQARAFASAGVAVLQIDLYGCGDSSGDFADARWEIWKDDLALAHAWLSEKTRAPISLWGLRLGALLALDYGRRVATPIDRFILWQPVTNGHAWMTQFLRIRIAGQMVNAPQEPSEGGGGVQAMRSALAQGNSLEVAGYELAPAMAAAIDAVDAAVLAPGGGKVDWFDVVAEAERPAPAASLRLVSAWAQTGVAVRHHAIEGPAFWRTPEITECAALVVATVGVLDLNDTDKTSDSSAGAAGSSNPA